MPHGKQFSWNYMLVSTTLAGIWRSRSVSCSVLLLLILAPLSSCVSEVKRRNDCQYEVDKSKRFPYPYSGSKWSMFLKDARPHQIPTWLSNYLDMTGDERKVTPESQSATMAAEPESTSEVASGSSGSTIFDAKVGPPQSQGKSARMVDNHCSASVGMLKFLGNYCLWFWVTLTSGLVMTNSNT
jgi:hypothetical protein